MANAERIEFESATLFKELVDKGQLKSLVSVKSSPYPRYCFKNTDKVADIVGKFVAQHNLKSDRSIDDCWETFDKDIDLRFEQIKKQMTAVSVSGQGKKGQKAAAKPLAKPAVQAPKGITPKDLYEAALTDLKNNKLTDAETKLNQFLTSYPKETLAGNAQYWLGEVYYKQQNFAKAAVAFKDGYSKYPQGAKGADCLLKLGLSMKALGKKEEACTAFVNLPTVFDKVNADIAVRAKKEAEALDCK